VGIVPSILGAGISLKQSVPSRRLPGDVGIAQLVNGAWSDESGSKWLMAAAWGEGHLVCHD